MGLSETIVAAMIGAVATVTTALFQIFTAFRARGKVDVKPRRSNTLRSILAVLALMVASAAGGFLYSELLKQRNTQDMAALRQELRELKELTASNMRRVESPAPSTAVSMTIADTAPATEPPSDDGRSSSESIVYVPACRRPPDAAAIVGSCTEADAQRMALCGSIPSYARTRRIDLFVQRDAVQHPWDQHRVSLEDDLGGARFTGRSFEYAQGENTRAVCTSFLQWSSDHPHIARIVVHYGFGDRLGDPVDAPPADTLPMPVPAVLAAEPVR